ncbi:MAG: hypothetical protein Q8S58_12885 [Bosea sp. (in: a-proteobacteria)]|uniref:hypothetical protein n=1 Tax=Bosea sp. (in: a-proteobacteria) TaxID=1871050 RepID=UPI0027324140|nr:hypothetical protein [Bosea sp. (in: a-proteobacteria)]MDP3255417.1 hypothetical protein [Bosea sp. (in: a-proteobacteria)]MDP3320016.1 hypothetical protein [Bosea sp. (in: a-proteobacteria)]
MIRQLFAASVVAALMGVAAPAAALPLSAPASTNLLPIAPAPLAETVQYRGNERYRGPGPGVRRYGPPRHRYAPGQRFRAPPPGYRRYGARPGNWRTRGCVTVGAIWFCP